MYKHKLWNILLKGRENDFDNSKYGRGTRLAQNSPNGQRNRSDFFVWPQNIIWNMKVLTYNCVCGCGCVLVLGSGCIYNIRTSVNQHPDKTG